MTLIRTILIGTSIAAMTGSSLSHAAVEKLLAKNKQWDLQAIAQTSAGEWCEKDITIHYKVGKPDFFSGEHANVFTKKLIKLVGSKCKKAETLSVKGFDGIDVEIFRKEALKSGNWEINDIPLVAESVTDTTTASSETSTVQDTTKSKLKAWLEQNSNKATGEKENNASSPTSTKNTLSKTEIQKQLTQNIEVSDDKKTQPNAIPGTTLTIGNYTFPDSRLPMKIHSRATHYTIKDKSESCEIYVSGSNKSVEESNVLTVDTGDCSSGRMEGPATVKVHSSSGRKIRTLVGFFSSGFYTGSVQLETNTAFRLPKKFKDEEILHYVESDTDLNVHYLARLNHSRYRWSYCSSIPGIEVIAANENIIRDDNTRAKIVKKARSITQLNCPDSKSMLLSVSFDPLASIDDDDDKMLLQLYDISKQNTSKKSYTRNKDYVHLRDEAKRRRIVNAMMVCKTSFSEGDHEKTLESCNDELIASNAQAQAFIKKSIEREELRDEAIVACQKFTDSGKRVEVLKACNTDILKGVPEAQIVIENSKERMRARKELLANRTLRHKELKTEYKNSVNQWQKGKKLAKRFETVSQAKRLSYLVDNKRIYNAKKFSTYSLISGREVDAGGYYLVNITDIDDGIAIANEPYPMNILDDEEGIPSEGWYLVSGKMTADENLMRNKRPVAELLLSKFYACEKDACKEANDVSVFVRNQLKITEWNKDKAPPEPAYDFILAEEFPDLTAIPLKD